MGSASTFQGNEINCVRLTLESYFKWFLGCIWRQKMDINEMQLFWWATSREDLLRVVEFQSTFNRKLGYQTKLFKDASGGPVRVPVMERHESVEVAWRIFKEDPSFQKEVNRKGVKTMVPIVGKTLFKFIHRYSNNQILFISGSFILNSFFENLQIKSFNRLKGSESSLETLQDKIILSKVVSNFFLEWKNYLIIAIFQRNHINRVDRWS